MVLSFGNDVTKDQKSRNARDRRTDEIPNSLKCQPPDIAFLHEKPSHPLISSISTHPTPFHPHHFYFLQDWESFHDSRNHPSHSRFRARREPGTFLC